MSESTSHPAREHPDSDLRVLLVEDSPDDAALIGRELKRAGFRLHVKQVQDAAAMRAALESEKWDIVLSDHSMPHFSSLDALRLLQGLNLDIPFILVSGSIGESQAVEAMKAGAHDYVMKDKLGRLSMAMMRELREADSRRARRKAEDELRLSEQRFRELVEQIPAITYIASLGDDRTVFYISPQIEKVLGLPPGDQRHLWRSHLHPEDRERVAMELAHTREHLAPFSSIYRLNAPSGRTVWVQDNATIVFDQAGRPAFLRGFMQDITERRHMEETLVERDEQLRNVQKMEAVGRLAGGVAHDFNNLLTPILGYGKILQDGQLMDEDQRSCVDEMMRAAERAANLVRQLLAFSRKQIPQMRPVQLNTAVREMENFLRRTLGEDMDLEVQLGPDLGWLRADPTHVAQVIMNLALNARDAMSSGGKLTIATANVDLRPEDLPAHPGASVGPYVQLKVRDTGCGMTKEVSSRVFEPFFTTKGEGKGTGLGLFIVYGIVQQCRGAISLATEPGHGTEIKILFPRVPEPAMPVQTTAPTRLPRGTESILVVEDESLVRRLTVLILTSLGYEVTEAVSGEDAIAARRKRGEPFDLVLTDVVMPRMGGRELAEELARLGDKSRVAFTSGFTQDELVLRGLDHNNSNPLIMKPYTRDILARFVRDVMDSKPGSTPPP